MRAKTKPKQAAKKAKPDRPGKGQGEDQQIVLQTGAEQIARCLRRKATVVVVVIFGPVDTIVA
ncbi:MAG: hypothetical protein ABSE57_21805 [Bryobacteraceae bacterium]